MNRPYSAGKPPSWPQARLEQGMFWFLRTLLRPLGFRRGTAVAAWLARTIGSRLWFMRRAHEAFDRVRPNYSPAERRRICRGAVDSFARTLVGYLNFSEFADPDRFDIKVEGLEHLQAAHEAGEGRVIYATAHFGNWEGVRVIASRYAQAPAIIYRALNNPAVDARCFELLTSMGWPAFRKGREGGRDLFRHVRDGGAAMILVDQRMGGAPILDFLGKPAETSPAAAQLALKFNAPLLPACARWTKDGLVARFEPAVPPSEPVEMMQRVNDHIGAWINADPEQWLWLHRRWKIRDIGAKSRKFEAPAPQS